MIKNDVFISYSRDDGWEWAQKLYLELNRNGIKAWRDDRDIDPYLDFTSELEKQLKILKY